ncbi:MGMT family protein [Saccharicrinis fermentans]|uniref:Methylated-DNA-protein-cysteine methyltransferase n=1 Tax=Saccharicrinis fermentans DSM 9555 = JCM 21142 TaxID=869213 RepID=W7Y5H9_9BACT|nr:MGMT family protein [Saccharicrinis fermentans]GAF02818.1 methylated-DNA-protein-cysteine methyltransferase [Saccharicrinis fermentans DSM 9555 = JCM 21142]
MQDDFFQRVYEVVERIPWGKVTSYGAIARYLGTARSSRMVGWALSNLRHSEGYIPAHRVLNRNGQLSGKAAFGSDTLMQELLENEGMVVVNDQVVDFKGHFWDPVELDKEM